MKKIDIGQALANPDVAKALSVFTVDMMSNIEVTKCLREAFAQNEELQNSSKKLIEAIESYREKTIVRTPPPLAPPSVAPPPNKHIPKYYKDDIILYDDFDHEIVFIAIVTKVDIKKGNKPIYTIQKINSHEQPLSANEHNLFDVATLNTKIESLRKSLKDNLTKNARTDIDNILKIHLNNHKMLVAAIKENDNFEIGFKKRDWLSDPPKKLKSIVNTNNIDLFLSVMRAARVEQLVNMITNPTEEAKNLVELDNIYINLKKQVYLNDITSEDDKKKFIDAMSFVREEGISNAKSESDPEAVIEKLLAMAEADKIIMTEEIRKKEQMQKGGRRTKKTHYRKHIKTN